MIVCSRVNLCNNWCIFWLSETTKTPLGFALYTQGISFRTDAFQRVYKWYRDKWRRIWDYYNKTIKMKFQFIFFTLTISFSSTSVSGFKLKHCADVLPSSRPVLCSNEKDYRKNEQPPDKPLHIQVKIRNLQIR